MMGLKSDETPSNMMNTAHYDLLSGIQTIRTCLLVRWPLRADLGKCEGLGSCLTLPTHLMDPKLGQKLRHCLSE